jgi:hypothetical protein
VSGDLFCQGLSCDTFTDHGTEDSHHGSTSLVDLHIELVLQLITFQKVGDKGTSVSSSVVTGVVGSGPNGKLTDTREKENLGNSSQWNTEETHHTIGNVREANSHFLGEVSREFNSGIVEEHTDNGSHGNTSVLAFDGTTTFKVGMESSKLGGGVDGRVQPSQRIVKAKRSSDSDGRVRRVDTGLDCRGGALQKYNDKECKLVSARQMYSFIKRGGFILISASWR